MEGNAKAIRGGTQRVVIGDNERDVHGQVARLMPGEQIVQAVVFLGDEEGDAFALAGEVQTHLHFMPARHGLEPVKDLRLLQGEVFQVPLQPHEESILIRIDVLLQVDDVPFVG